VIHTFSKSQLKKKICVNKKLLNCFINFAFFEMKVILKRKIKCKDGLHTVFSDSDMFVNNWHEWRPRANDWQPKSGGKEILWTYLRVKKIHFGSW